jgi:GNAT superfamily N-acetyltransferase
VPDGQSVTDIALSGAQVNERWVLRTRLPDGSATDVTGWLTALGDDSVAVEIEGGERISVDRVTVIAARRVPAARGGPDPRRTSAEALEWAALPGWVALSEPLGEWTLRAGGGFTGRANSALAVGDPGLPLVAAADRVVAYAREHRIPAWAQVVVGSEVDAGLVEIGWRPVYVVTDVLVSRLVTLLAGGLPDPRVRIGTDLTDAWWNAYGRSRPSPLNPVLRTDADPAMLRMILDGHPPRAFAWVEETAGAEPIAIARGHVTGPWLGIASVWTDPGSRRQGLATSMMRSLGHWAARQGARYAYLQVAQQNSEAHTAYGRLGFVLHHSYRYLTAPSDHRRNNE